MARVFISYSHNDKDIIEETVSKLESAGHTADIDSEFLTTGDPISTRIKQRINTADLVAVFLSSHSAASPWVEKELNESILKELKSGRLCLVPCPAQRARQDGSTSAAAESPNARISGRRYCTPRS